MPNTAVERPLVDPADLDDDYIHVVAAIIWKQGNRQNFLIARRQQGKRDPDRRGGYSSRDTHMNSFLSRCEAANRARGAPFDAMDAGIVTEREKKVKAAPHGKSQEQIDFIKTMAGK